MKLYNISSRLAGYLACQVGLEESKIDTVRFGLEVILGEIIKWFILLSIATLMGVLPGALFAMVSMAVFRVVSGGAHCEDYWRCLAFSMLLFIGGGKLGIYAASLISQQVLIWTILAGSIVSIVPVLIWAPGEVPNRKIKPEEKGPFKILSLLILVIWMGLTVLVIVPYSLPVAVAGYLIVIFQVFSFTPLGFHAIDRFDIILSKILGERRCYHA